MTADPVAPHDPARSGAANRSCGGVAAAHRPVHRVGGRGRDVLGRSRKPAP
ncbi:hypothetical protein ACWD0J_38690 [Streptomyces sp. NPDC003011]